MEKIIVNWQKAFVVVLSAAAFQTGTTWASPKDRIGEKLADVTLQDLRGKSVQLLDLQKDGVLVIAYTGLGCPIAGRYAPRLEALSKKFAKRGVRFVGINANPQDSAADIAEECKELGITFLMLQDAQQALTRQLDAKTTTEAFVVDKNGVIRYRGMIDDQYAIAAQRDKPRHRYLERAIRAVLRGKELETERTAAPGCLITRAKATKSDGARVTYSSHIARIIQDNCQSCHRPTQIAPFPLMSYRAVRGWSAMIHSVVDEGRMPPWNAHKEHHGVFVNERVVPEGDKKILLAWIEDGMPRGNPDDDPPSKHWPNRWRIGEPDKVFTMRKAFSVPAEGVVQYQYFTIPMNFKKDMWVERMEARPGAADVVHHIVAFTIDRENPKVSSQLGLDEGFLCATVPGDIPSVFAEGYAKKIPAGHDLLLQVHYTTNGKKRKDKCKVAMIFADRAPDKEVLSRGIYNMNFKIPPGDPNYEVRASHTFEQDTTVLSLYPHMHFRGKDWTYVAHFPDGTKKTLLSVPQYDYNWQESYIFKEPVLLPKGTRLECIAHYDNSEGNFVNPDPTATVTFGEQSWDEMMFGYLDYVVSAE